MTQRIDNVEENHADIDGKKMQLLVVLSVKDNHFLPKKLN
ncbi:hypothetical protein CWATWH8502_1716 [Crocosphaera watsonii WH 8502]|uniref:Uncharacterized protein n=4 Tax=Crocosphaera watsonii TaxID=263511 RepID=G5J447_CROWT|nr:hypothetical protein CWATWH0003_2270 [Crocosphaera watsonii WH 0003]CCQ50093.1 hypothetical protein CWATWH8502_1716 [Crocosphaera watsonii WH 8502]CCQ58629.1 hypothetical protein CWATWH0005_2082 [Crocosphaera watsonii WH 0005]CCQ61212.1 hypothetical protein CWATWH0401_4363 [Crocosphaera watsonii WH 0401]